MIRRAHEFEGDGEVGIRFCCSVVVYEVGDCIYVARVPEEIPLEGPLRLEEIKGKKVIMEHIFPRFDPKKFTVAADLLPTTIYWKRPSLIDYDEKEYEDMEPDGSIEAKLVIREAEIYEKLMRFPHENIVRYYGCKVRDERLVGLCLEKLDETLGHRLNHTGGSLNFDVDNCMRGIRNGIAHLHKIGLCHNDLNPTNIMFRKNGTPVIIDFDSCQPTGEKLTLKFGTEGWYDPDREVSAIDNDMNGLDGIESYVQNCMANS